MIQRFEVAALHSNLDADTQEYAVKKLASLDASLPRHSRPSAHMEVRLQATTDEGKKVYICEVTLSIPHKNFVVTEQAATWKAAIDVARTCLKYRINEHKAAFTGGKRTRHLFARLRRRMVFVEA